MRAMDSESTERKGGKFFKARFRSERNGNLGAGRGRPLRISHPNCEQGGMQTREGTGLESFDLAVEEISIHLSCSRLLFEKRKLLSSYSTLQNVRFVLYSKLPCTWYV